MKNKNVFDYINEYYEKAKQLFEFNDIKISKTGVIGYLLYVLGHIKSDSKYYYDYLYKELSPLTAQEYSSMLLHASLFGYIPSFAKPATYNGTIEISLPKLSTNITTRTIIIPKGTKFNILNTIWTLDAEITVTRTHTNSYVVFSSQNNNDTKYVTIKENIYNPSLEIIEFPLEYLRQYEEEIIEFTMPKYEYPLFYKYVLEVPDNKQIADLDVYVTYPNQQKRKFKILLNKIESTSIDEVVFLSQLSRNKYILEFGNGQYGIIVPENSTIQIYIKYTLGTQANFYNGDLIPIEPIHVIDKYIDNTEERYTIDNSVIGGKITSPITDGKDIPSIDEIRRDLLTYIRTKNYLVTQQDYLDLYSSLFNTSVLFKKINFVDDDVYIYTTLTNSLFLPRKTITLTLEESIFNPNNYTYVYKPTYTYVKRNKVAYPFDTHIYTTADISDTNIIPVNDTSVFNTGMQITFNNDINNIYTVQSIDTANNTIILDRNVNVLSNTEIQYVDYEKVDLISPFLYVKDNILNGYKGYFIDDQLLSLDISTIYNKNEKIPNIYLQIKLTEDLNSIIFKIIPYSTQVLDDYTFSLTVDKFDIRNIILDRNNSYTFEYNITDKAYIFDILTNLIDINVLVMNLYGDEIALLTKEQYQYLIDINDSLLLKYYTKNDIKYVMQIPFISIDEYNNEAELINEQLRTIFIDSKLAEYRLIGINHSVRFHNTLEIIYDLDKYLSEEVPVDYINLPLKLKLYIKFDKSQILINNVSLETLIEDIKLALIKYLNDNYTGDKIEYYKSKIEDFVHNNKYVKYVEVLEPDYNIIVKDYTKYLSQLTDKLDIVKFAPIYFWWDINNIDIIFDLV